MTEDSETAMREPTEQLDALSPQALSPRAMLAYGLLAAGAVALMSGSVARSVLDGGLLNPDSYMRLVRLETMLRAHAVVDVIGRDGSGSGTLLYWSHLLDSLILVLAAPLTLVTDPHTALRWSCAALGPLGMGGLGAAIAWAAAPFADRRWLWLGPVLVAASPATANYGLPGVVHHHVPLVLTATVIAGWAGRLLAGRSRPKAGWSLGAWAGAGIWLSPEAMPFVLMGFLALWLGWLLDRRRTDPARTSHTVAGAGSVLAAPKAFRALRILPVLAAARKAFGTTMPVAIIPRQCEKSGLAAEIGNAGLAFLIVIGAAFAVDPPYGGYGVVEIDRLSIVYVVLALVCCLAGCAVALTNRPSFAGAAGRAFAIGIAALGGAAWLGAFPAVLRGPDGLMDAASASAFFGGIAEMQPVRSLADAAQYLLGGTIAAGALGWFAWRRRSALLGYAALCAVALLVLGAAHERFAAYAAAAAAMLLPVIITHIEQAMAEMPPIAPAIARAGLISVLLLASRAEGLPRGIPSLIGSAGAQEVAAASCSVRHLAALLRPFAGQVVLGDVDDTPELLYRTGILTVGSLYHHNVAAFLRLRAAWRSGPSSGEPDAVRQTGASAVLFCPHPARSLLVADLPPDTLLDRLARHEVPPWLREVAADAASGNVLYRVVR